MLVNEPVQYPKPDEDDASRETLLPEHRNENPLPSAPPPQQVVQFHPHPGQVCHLKWWLTKYFADPGDVFHMYAEMGNDECTEMQLKLQDSQNPSVIVTTPKVGGTGLNLPAGNHAEITRKFWASNEQWQAFAHVVRLGRNRIPHTGVLNTDPGAYDNGASDLHYLASVAQMCVLHSFMSRPTSMTLMIYRILESREKHSVRLTENGDMLQSDEPSIFQC